MPTEVPAIRIWPMSDKIKGFLNRPIEDVQTNFFLRTLPARQGRYRYPSAGLNADPHTVVLFQYRARIIASATFLRDEKLPHPNDGYAGTLHFDPASIRTFTPLDLPAMRAIWPHFRAFGHVKQHLNPTLYPTFLRHLKHVTRPAR